MAWFANVPHKELSVEKAVQNWIRVDGDKFRFPGGGTMFPRGADAYIDDIDKLISLRDGTIRTAIDTGCGVSSILWSLFNLGFQFSSLCLIDEFGIASFAIFCVVAGSEFYVTFSKSW